MFFLFFASVLSDQSGLVSTETVMQWRGTTYGSKVYFATGDGNIFLVDIFTGHVNWSIKTGDSTFQSCATKKSYFIPSIDGFLFVHSDIYGYRQMPYPIRDLVYVSPIVTETGELFAASKNMYLFDIDKSGNIIASNQINTSIPSQQPEEKDDGNLLFVRIDYELNVQGKGAQIIKYSEYDVIQNQIPNKPINDVEIWITFQGGVSISVNGSITAQIKLPTFPFSILSPKGKFEFCLATGGDQLPKNRVFFLDNYFGSSIAFPSFPLQSDLDVRLLMSELPAISGSVRTDSGENYSQGSFDLTHREYYFRPLQKNTDITRPANAMSDTDRIIPHYRFHFPFISSTVILSITFIAIQSINFLITKLLDAEGAHVKITSKSETAYISSGTYSGVPCTVVRIPYNNRNLQIVDNIKDFTIPGTAKYKGSEIHDNYILIAYQTLTPYNFDNFDILVFLRKTMETLLNLFKNGYVHGSINLDCIYVDQDGLPLIGGFEKSCHKSEDDEERAADIQAVGRLIAEVLKDGTDPLIIDLLNEMNSNNYIERPTPIEVLRHPFFFSGLQKVNMFLRGSDFLQSTEVRRTGKLQKFEDYRTQVVGGNWMSTLDSSLLTEAMKHCAYSGDSLADLVRFIRNKWVHSPKNLPPDQNTNMNNICRTPESYFQYFHLKYPNLFLYLYYFLDSYDRSSYTM